MIGFRETDRSMENEKFQRKHVDSKEVPRETGQYCCKEHGDLSRETG